MPQKFCCKGGVWDEPVFVSSECAAGYAFACYDCLKREKKECPGYPCHSPQDRADHPATFKKFLRDMGLEGEDLQLGLRHWVPRREYKKKAV